ncbi:MAG: NrfD/PsrC family molybdoenzyme membrane anchor subunit [Magnetospirillum sp.]
MFEYNWHHIAPWGWELSVYFFLIGTAGMAYALATAPVMFGGRFDALRPLQLPGLILAFIIVLICGPLLIHDLGQPTRFLYPIIYFHWTSPLSWGSVFLLMFSACVVLFWWFDRSGNSAPLKPLAIVGSLLGLSMPLYTGNDLMVQTTREVWATPWIPVLFVVLSVTSGAAALAVIAMLRKTDDDDASKILHAVMLSGVATTLFLFLGLLLSFLYGSEEMQLGWNILNDQFAMQVWLLTFVVGILAPLALLVRPDIGRRPQILAAAGVASLIGAYAFREVILVAGQLPQLYY